MKVRMINIFSSLPVPSKFTTTKSVQLKHFQHATPTSWTPQYSLAPQILDLRYLVSSLSLRILEHCTFTDQIFFFAVPGSCFFVFFFPLPSFILLCFSSHCPVYLECLVWGSPLSLSKTHTLFRVGSNPISSVTSPLTTVGGSKFVIF